MTARLVATVLLLSMLVACGAQSEAERVVADVTAAQTARLDGDGEAVCSHMSGKMKRDLTAQAAVLGETTCAGAVERVLDSEGPEDRESLQRSRDALGPDDVSIRGTRATVSYVSGNQQPVVKIGDDWYLNGGAKKRRRR